jgi:hypothetical protein
MRNGKGVGLALALACTALTASCTCNFGALATGPKKAEKAVQAFHAGVNEGRFDALYDAGSDDLRAAASKERFVALLSAVRRKLGPVTGTTNAGWRVRSHNLSSYVDVTQHTRFEQGQATEQFTFVVSGDEVRLVAYHISSEDLILR